LESSSRTNAAVFLEKHRVAAASHILIADETATSFEFSSSSLTRLDTCDGYLGHTNHFLREHDVEDTMKMKDSKPRMARLSVLLAAASITLQKAPETPPVTILHTILEDEQDFPVSINRKSSADNPSSTLFTIMVDLKQKSATVKLGRPTEPEGTWTLKPGEL
jgi:isopenicillin-N N-acyltransferase-like protein